MKPELKPCPFCDYLSDCGNSVTKSDFTTSDITPNAFVGYLGKTEGGKAELAKKEMVKAFNINKTMEGGNK